MDPFKSQKSKFVKCIRRHFSIQILLSFSFLLFFFFFGFCFLAKRCGSTCVLAYAWLRACYLYPLLHRLCHSAKCRQDKKIFQIIESCKHLSNRFLCRLRSIAAHRDHFVRRLYVRPVRLLFEFAECGQLKNIVAALHVSPAKHSYA